MSDRKGSRWCSLRKRPFYLKKWVNGCELGIRSRINFICDGNKDGKHSSAVEAGCFPDKQIPLSSSVNRPLFPDFSPPDPWLAYSPSKKWHSQHELPLCQTFSRRRRSLRRLNSFHDSPKSLHWTRVSKIGRELLQKEALCKGFFGASLWWLLRDAWILFDRS